MLPACSDILPVNPDQIQFRRAVRYACGTATGWIVTTPGKSAGCGCTGICVVWTRTAGRFTT